ncbi:MAG: hypothetical protein EZS28_039223 [Streblomastix strix]|uniref:Uncharacterized protein n=1 Tax=Streblomastix strix TaxID=222440 RepID=A0A5J4U518_9EUKA|nr:MAG: hypothetical protein EZS28_039223 [Streblomastix strix]
MQLSEIDWFNEQCNANNVTMISNKSKKCLSWNQQFGDEQEQTELVNQEYGKMICISFSTAGGIGEEQDEEIWNVLLYINWFIREQNKRKNFRQPFFQLLPLLARRTEEQIEEEGANEEIETQVSSNGLGGRIKYWANEAKKATLNHFIRRG